MVSTNSELSDIVLLKNIFRVHLSSRVFPWILSLFKHKEIISCVMTDIVSRSSDFAKLLYAPCVLSFLKPQPPGL